MKLIPEKYVKVEVEKYPYKETKNPPLVSVCIQTYNQENYIANCVETILNQITNFEYEIVIGDDESSDRTREICIEYAEKYPEKIRLILHKRENVITIKGKPIGRFNMIYNMQEAKGKFLAFCEGDDYWISPTKLQRQVDQLQSDNNCALVFSNYSVLNKDGSEHPKYDKVTLKEDKFFDTHYILKKNIMPATCTIMWRKDFIPIPLPDFIFECFNGDWAFLFILTQRRKIGYIDEPLSVYRKGVGILSKTENYIKFKNGLKLNKTLNKYTNFEFKYHIGKYEWHIENLVYALLEEKKIAKALLLIFSKLYRSLVENSIKHFFSRNTNFLKHTIKHLLKKDI